MSISVNYDMGGMDRLNLRLSHISTDLSEPIEEAMLEIMDITTDRFQKEDDGTRRWKNLSPQRVRQRGAAHPILRYKGVMFASIVTRGGAGNIFEVGRMLGRVGTRDRKARFHQFGLGFNPRRAFLTLTRADKADLAGLFVDYIRDQLEEFK